MMKKTGITSGRTWNTRYQVLSTNDMIETTLN